MTLYVYKAGEQAGGASGAPLLAIENAVSYTADRAVTADGDIYGPFGEDCELSSLPDCSEALRARWRREHPSAEERVEELEALVARLLFGGEGA